MKLTFLGGVHEVTGSCTLVEAAGKRILVDCGLEQGQDLYVNCDLPVAAQELDAVLLTHAHIDHSGRIPALVAQGYRGPIHATLATAELCKIMLRDSAHIQESEAQWRNRKAQRSGEPQYEPEYTMADAEQAISQFIPGHYGVPTELFPGIQITFSDAGHLLGSASILLELQEGEERRSVLFSGDLGNHTRPLIRDFSPPPQADYVIIESTYGDRSHGPRPDYVTQLARILQETFDRGGNVVIPSFAVGRTQELLYLLRAIGSQGLVRGHEGFQVYVDSPLAVEATRIYSMGLTEFYDRETLELLRQGIDPIRFPGLRLSITSEESKAINFDTAPKVILSASGMCEAGRIRHHLKHNLWRSDSTVLFVGYQSAGSVGRRLQDGAKQVRLFGEDIAVNAHIETLDGISGHADREMLLSWLGQLEHKPRQVFVNHGDDQVCDLFAQTVEAQLRTTAAAPYSGDCYDLVTGACLAKGVITPVDKAALQKKKVNTVFQRLLASVKRLGKIAENASGWSNKELARFADQIDTLCKKYDRK